VGCSGELGKTWGAGAGRAGRKIMIIRDGPTTRVLSRGMGDEIFSREGWPFVTGPFKELDLFLGLN